MPKLSIVVPFYNEPSLEPLFERLASLEASLKDKGFDSEMIFVDDGSDSAICWEEVRAFKGKRNTVKAIRLARNFGSFHAMKTGFAHASGDCFAPMSADLQDPPEMLVEMAEKWQAGSKFVIAVRRGRDDALSTRLFAALYYKLIRAVAIRDFPPSGYDIALMDKSLLPYILQSSVMLNFRLLAYWLGFTPEVIYYQRAKRQAGETHWGLAKQVNLLMDSVISFSIWPARFFLYLGGLLGLGATFSLGWQLAQFIFSEAFSATTMLISLVALGAGLIMAGLGLIAEYLWRILALAANRPEVVIDEVL